MRPEEIGSREARVVMTADEIEQLGALALEAGNQELAQSFTAMRAQMEEYENRGIPRFVRPLPPRPTTARDIIGDERMDKLEKQWESRNAAAAKGRLARARRRRIVRY